MAALPIARFRIEAGDGFSMPCVSLRDRRARGHPVVRFIYQRHLETVLYGRIDGSSGPIWKLLNNSGLGSTALAVNKAAVTTSILTQDEFTQLMATFKEALPADVIDPCSLGRIRNCTLLPLATAAAIARSFGRSGASMAWLRAFSQQVPEAWALREEQEQNAANLEVDLVLEAQLEEQGDFEAEEISFAEELTRMPAFNAIVDDETRMATYILQPVPSILKSELDTYIEYRTATFAARRQGGAVQSISAESDKTALLRFYGYMHRLGRVPEGQLLYLSLMIRADLGNLVEQYASWLQNTQRCRFSTIANYLNGLVSIVSYCYANLEPSDAVLNTEPNPLAQIINLRGQAEKAAKTQQMYDERVGGWLTWEDVQKARVKCFEKLDESQWGTPAEKRFALRDATAISLLSLIPPDRLRLGHTLKKKEGGGWKMDLSKQRDGHKTSRFYGPFAASLPEALTPVLDAYTAVLTLEPGGDAAYLFHPPQSHFDRPMEPSAWTGWVKRLFKRHHGSEVAPKTLRSVFITWLRDSTNAPAVLKSAAHAMKHSEQRQASNDYDQQADDRLVKAAYDFNLSYASQYGTEVPAGNGAGSSTTHRAAAAAAPPAPRPSRPGKETGMAMARAMAVGGVAVAGAVLAPAAPPSNAAPAAMPAVDPPAAAEPATRRCVFADCKSDTPAEGLRECACGNGPHHHFCSIAAGCEADVSLCARCLGHPVFAPDAGAHVAAEVAQAVEAPQAAVAESMDAAVVADAAPDALVDDEWQPLPGGPWTAKLMRPSRQPVATATYRNFYVAVAFDPVTTPLVPGGEVKFPVVAGGPAEGIICRLPSSWTSRQRSLIFRLKLSKAGATESTVTINSAFYRQPVEDNSTEEEEEEEEAPEPAPPPVLPPAPVLLADEPPLEAEPEPPVVPLAAVPPAVLAVAARAAPGAPPPPPPHDADTARDANAEDAADAVQAAIRATHLEANGGMPDTISNAVPSLAAICRDLLCRAHVPLPGEGEAAVEPPSAGDVPMEHADAMGAAAAEEDAAAASEDDSEAEEEDAAASSEDESEAEPAGAGPSDDSMDEDDELPPPPAPPADAQFDAQWAAALLAPAPPPPASPMGAELAPMEDADMPPPLALAPPAAPQRVSQRASRKRERFGDGGELDGAASSFQSAPPPRKPSVDPSIDMGVPAFAMQGEDVWAMGLRGGVRLRFRAHVTGLRKHFPRIIVRYTATEDGETNRHALPDLQTAYLTMADVSPRDW